MRFFFKTIYDVNTSEFTLIGIGLDAKDEDEFRTLLSEAKVKIVRGWLASVIVSDRAWLTKGGADACVEAFLIEHGVSPEAAKGM